jgi:hypothetical protein
MASPAPAAGDKKDSKTTSLKPKPVRARSRGFALRLLFTFHSLLSLRVPAHVTGFVHLRRDTKVRSACLFCCRSCGLTFGACECAVWMGAAKASMTLKRYDHAAVRAVSCTALLCSLCLSMAMACRGSHLL